MLRKDYLQRQFEEFGKFMAIVFGLKNAKQWAELERLINTSSPQYASVEIEVVEGMKHEQLLHELVAQRRLKEDELKILGDLLYEKGLIYTEVFRGDAALNAFSKALQIYEHLQHNALESDFSLDMHYKMKTIRQLLGS